MHTSVNTAFESVQCFGMESFTNLSLTQLNAYEEQIKNTPIAQFYLKRLIKYNLGTLESCSSMTITLQYHSRVAVPSYWKWFHEACLITTVTQHN